MWKMSGIRTHNLLYMSLLPQPLGQGPALMKTISESRCAVQRNHLAGLPWVWFPVTISVTRLGNLFDFGQVLKAFGNNYFAQISHILRHFLQMCQNLSFF